jgi:putative secretion ATPase (PEP-CTERM system associated)
MYELYYKFTAEPFRLSPDHRFCFEHKSYGKARAYMAYAFKRAEGFVMITGRPGTGKTTLIGELVESLSRDKVVTANLVCTQLQADDLLKTVAYSFGISPAQVGKAELLQRLNILLHRWHREGRRALLVVDEAQDLSSSAMEELRLLTNIQFGGQPLLQIFLLGQPELRDLILSPEMEQVHQRIVAASHIEGLEESETEAYVIHRLSVVGWQGNPAIDRAIFPYIHKFSEGVPRRINLICSRLFLLGSVEERQVIGVADVRVVIGELQAENLAAGTGISLADFHSTAEPQWAPVPLSESPVPSLPPLQATNTSSFAVIDEAEEVVPDQQPVEVKKKAIPRLEPLSTSPPANESGIPNVAAVRFEFVSENDVETDEPSSDDVLAPNVRLSGSDDPGNRLVTTNGGAVESAAPRKRLIVMSFLAIATIALVLLMKSCFVTSDELSFREMRGGAPVSEEEAPVTTGSGGNKLVQATGAEPVSQRVDKEAVISATPAGAPARPSVKTDQTTQPQPAGKTEPGTSRNVPVPSTDVSDRDQKLVPIVVAANHRPIPVASAALPERVDPMDPQEEINPAESSEAGPSDASSAGDSNKVSTEIAMTRDRVDTILISFPFDSDDLIPDSHIALDRAATLMRDDTSSVASITGFTDNQGDTQYNLILSRKRANAVEQYLVGAGIARDRLRVEGRGVLTDPVEVLSAGEGAAMEPYRIVRIKLGSDG